MLDFGWSELILIMALAVLVIGPKELPVMMRGLGRLVRRLQYVKYAFSQQFEEFMQDSDMEDIGRSVNFEENRAQYEDADEDEQLAATASPSEPLTAETEEGDDNERK
jgi:sec-independent protein translocase protein TatB